MKDIDFYIVDFFFR